VDLRQFKQIKILLPLIRQYWIKNQTWY